MLTIFSSSISLYARPILEWFVIKADIIVSIARAYYIIAYFTEKAPHIFIILTSTSEEGQVNI